MSEKIKLNIAGMSCVNCSNAIERVAKKTQGVLSASVNFADGSGEFEISQPAVREILEAKIKKLGYEIAQDYEEFELKQSARLKAMERKFIFTVAVSVAIMALETLGARSVFKDALMLILAFVALAYGGREFFTHALSAVRNKNYDMNVLVALGTASAFIYSLIVFLFQKFLPPELNNMYVSGSSMIIGFVLLGKYLEERSKARAGDYLKTLLKISPKTALLIKPDGQNEEVEVSKLNAGDIVVVKNGYNVPCDGVIVQGGAEIDASTLTGESLPAYKEVGDAVFAGTSNVNGYISVKVLKRSNATMLSQILSLLNEASAKKMPVSRFADRAANIFVPSVVAISILTFIVWIIASGNFAYAASNAICVLIISCPCALGLAVPIGIISALARGAKEGIIVKNPEIIEIMHEIKTVAFDKTGTLTSGQIGVKSSDLSDADLLLVASVEALSEHPISKAIVKFAEQNCVKPLKIGGKFENIAGLGVKYRDENNLIIIGNEKLLASEGVELNNEQKAKISRASQSCASVALTAINGEFRGILSLSDELKQDAAQTISGFKSLGVKTAILSGDNQSAVSRVAAEIGADEFYASMLPGEKFERIKELGARGKVMFVGDGVNDSASLKLADVGVAMNSGSDVAKGAGDVVLIKNDVKGALNLLKLGFATMKIIRQNLFWAFGYNAICIPIAAGALYPAFGMLLDPAYGALAMCFSSVTVVLNSIRLRFLKF